jgi:hypothetical protein
MRNVCKQWAVFANNEKEGAKQAITLTIEGKKVNAMLLFNPKDREIITSSMDRIITKKTGLQTNSPNK